MHLSRFLRPALFLLSILAIYPARAEAPPDALVGRVAVVEGNLSLRPAGGGWIEVERNYPITAGMALRSTARPRLEAGGAVLRIGPVALALSAGSELDLARLDPAAMQLVLRSGRFAIRLARADGRGTVEIDTPRGSLRLSSPGEYDIAAGEERMPARVAVFAGEARLAGAGFDLAVSGGAIAALGDGAPSIRGLDASTDDEFSRWWRDASRPEQSEPETLRHVSAEMTGYDALDKNGNWEAVEGYGAVWFPNVVPEDWTPYRFGHWRWVSPWGWSWIDDMPWGFAPSHYGRWARFSGVDTDDTERWGWVPGSRIEHPVYTPAAVAFLGTAGVGLSYPDAFGPAVAWFPLAPGEVYWPSYTGDLDAIRRLNDGNVANLSEIVPGAEGAPPADIVNGDYRNRRFATAVPRSVFLTGKAVAPGLIQLPNARLEAAPLLAGSPQLAPPSPVRLVAAAVASAVAGRVAIAPPPRLARAIRALAGILGRHTAGTRIATPNRRAVVVAARHFTAPHITGYRGGRLRFAVAHRR